MKKDTYDVTVEPFLLAKLKMIPMTSQLDLFFSRIKNDTDDVTVKPFLAELKKDTYDVIIEPFLLAELKMILMTVLLTKLRKRPLVKLFGQWQILLISWQYILARSKKLV